MSTKNTSQDKEYYDFETVISPDGFPYMTFQDEDGREPGFFFAVTGIPTNKDDS